MELTHRATKPAIATALLLLMVLTRYHHFGSALHLPDASWAIFLAGGFYLGGVGFLALMLAAAGGIDYFAITQGGTDSYCVTAAYPFLIAAYGALWSAGSWYKTKHRTSLSTLPALTSTIVLSVTACFIISNAAFYAFSGNFSDMTAMEYTHSVLRYYPQFLLTTAAYIGAFALIHVIASNLVKPGNGPVRT